MEQEEDKAVQKFEENNEINFKLNEKIEKSVNQQNVRFFGIANEQTKFLGIFKKSLNLIFFFISEKMELDISEIDKNEGLILNQKKKKYEILEFIFS